MIENPNPHLLDRLHSAELVEQWYGDYLICLEDMVNWGSNLIFRLFNSSQKKLPDLILCTVLLKHMVSMLDGAHISLKAGSAKPALLSLRGAFESAVYLRWMVESETEKKSVFYYVAELRRQLGYIQRVISSPEHSDLKDQALADRAALQHELASARFAPCNDEFSKKRGKKDRDNDWYSIVDPKMNSVAKLAGAVGQMQEYELIYGRTSQVMHARSYRDQVRLGEGVATLQPIRDAVGTREALQYAFLIAPGIYRLLTKLYRPAELRALDRKYHEDWRGPTYALADVDEERFLSGQ